MTSKKLKQVRDLCLVVVLFSFFGMNILIMDNPSLIRDDSRSYEVELGKNRGKTDNTKECEKKTDTIRCR